MKWMTSSSSGCPKSLGLDPRSIDSALPIFGNCPLSVHPLGVFFLSDELEQVTPHLRNLTGGRITDIGAASTVSGTRQQVVQLTCQAPIPKGSTIMTSKSSTGEGKTSAPPTHNQMYSRLKRKATGGVIAGLTTLTIAVSSAAAKQDGDVASAKQALRNVINSFIGILVDLGAVILFAYGAFLLVKMAFQGFRGQAAKKSVITFACAIVLLMFEDVITPLIRGIAENAQANLVGAAPEFAGVVAQLAVGVPL